MSEFEKDTNILNGKGEENGQWITARGNKIFIKNGENLEQTIKEHFAKIESNDNIKTQYENFGDYDDKDYAVKWANSLPANQYDAIFDYTKSGFVSINEILRTGKGSNIIENAQIENIQSGINKYELKKSIKVYRVSNEDILQGYNLDNIVGAILEDKGFRSCTTDEKYAFHILANSANEDILLEIGVPSGKGRGAYIAYASNYGTTESEFLLSKGSKIKIIGVDKKGSHTRIKGEYYE